MINVRLFAGLIIGTVLSFCEATPSYAETDSSGIAHLLQNSPVQIAGHVFHTKDLQVFYAARANRPLWEPSDLASLSATLQQIASDNGLDPAAYTLPQGLDDAALDVYASALFVHLARDLATGRIAPYRVVGGAGEATRPHFDALNTLKAVSQGKAASDILTDLLPQSADYKGLAAGLKVYRDLEAAGGWPLVADGPPVKPGESDERIKTLRQRLIITGDFVANPAHDPDDGIVLDDALSQGLKHFQLRHGLDADGALGKRTLAALRVTTAQRIHQIALTMERLRQLPRSKESNRIDVNIASQTLVLSETSTPTLLMRVVAGDIKHQTPTMATRVASLTLNPTWTVPPSIARKEILPKLKKDPNYLSHNNLRLLDSQYQETSESDGTGIDWTKLGGSFPFVLRQEAGSDNALGQIKFNLQNQDAIYMHDTPQKAFFKRSYRLLSHGCIRLEHPLDLADHLMGAEWHDKIAAMISDGKTKTLILKHSLPVYLLYQTAWTEADGSLSFREDAYGNDQRLDLAIGQAQNLNAKDPGQANL